MKVLLISDIHANYDALKAVEQKEPDFDEVWFAGDMVDYGLQPHLVVDWMRSHRALAVCGNHDRAIVNRYKKGFERLEDPLMAESFALCNLNLLSQDQMEYLDSLPESLIIRQGDTTYFMTHEYDPTDDQALLKQMTGYDVTRPLNDFWRQNVGASSGKRCLVLGHTHQCGVFQPMPDFWVINPGSVSYRVGTDVLTGGIDYMVLQDGIPYLRHASYDSSSHYRAVCASGFGQWEKDTGKNIYLPEKA